METARSWRINDEVIERIAQAKTMGEKLTETLVFFEDNMQELINIKEMLDNVQYSVRNGLFVLLPGHEHEIDALMSGLEWFLINEKDLKRFINAVRANSLRRKDEETRRQNLDENQNFM